MTLVKSLHRGDPNVILPIIEHGALVSSWPNGEGKICTALWPTSYSGVHVFFMYIHVTHAVGGAPQAHVLNSY